jgi:hypothetical protein
VTIFYCLRFETPPIWRARSPYLYPPGRGWPSYAPRHWVPFSSPPTTLRDTVELFHPASTRNSDCNASCLEGTSNSSARTMRKAQPLCCYRGMFTAPLHSNGRGADHIEITVIVLLRALPSNNHCLQSHRLATGLYAAI